MIPRLRPISTTATLFALALFGTVGWTIPAHADSCYGNLIRMACDLQNLSDDLTDELRYQLGGSPLLRHVLCDAREIEDLAHHVEEMAEDGETDCNCFRDTLAALHGEVHHLEELLIDGGYGRRSRRCLGEALDLLAHMDGLIVRMERTLDAWDVPVGFGRPSRGFDDRFGYNRPSIYDEDNPWTGTRSRRPVIATPTREYPVYRAIPVR
jgi:hypothetical protein